MRGAHELSNVPNDKYQMIMILCDSSEHFMSWVEAHMKQMAVDGMDYNYAYEYFPGGCGNCTAVLSIFMAK
jgi:hypothetical protein